MVTNKNNFREDIRQSVGGIDEHDGAINGSGSYAEVICY